MIINKITQKEQTPEDCLRCPDNGNCKMRRCYDQEEARLYKIRFRRKEECFSIINRGVLWYNTLTDEQKTELAQWYMAWLDAPETLIIPEKPEWLITQK